MSSFSALAALAQDLEKQSEEPLDAGLPPLPPASGPPTPGGQGPKFPGYKAMTEAMSNRGITPNLQQLQSPMAMGLPGAVGAPDNLISKPRAENLASQFAQGGNPSQGEYMDSPHGQQWLLNMAQQGGEAENAYQAPQAPSGPDIDDQQKHLATQMFGSGDASAQDMMPALQFLEQLRPGSPLEDPNADASLGAPPVEDPNAGVNMAPGPQAGPSDAGLEQAMQQIFGGLPEAQAGTQTPQMSPEEIFGGLPKASGSSEADDLMTMWEGARRLFDLD